MTMKKPWTLFFLLTLAFCTPQPSEEQGRPTESFSPDKLMGFMQEAQKHEALRHAMLGAYVVELDSDSVWLDYHSQWGMATGSTMKAITTATALASLGPDFTFQTQLGYSGKIEGSTLKGDLYIIGGGDPTLGINNLDGVLKRWEGAVKQAGIRTIEGDIIGDASYFSPYLLPRTWIWEDLGNYYGAGACALNIHENYYRLYFSTPSTGGVTKIKYMTPKVDGLSFQNELVSGPVGSGDKGYIFGAPFTYNRVMRGTVPPNRKSFSLKGSLPDPALQTAQWLKAQLKKSGIEAKEARSNYRQTNNTPSLSLIDTLLSPTLSKIVDKTNTKSVNTYAEAMLKMLGKKLQGEGSTKAGAAAVMNFWKDKNLEMEGFIMEDGSGLSRFNSITPKQITEILAHCTQEAWFQEFESSLAVAGQKGTLRRMCINSPATGRIFAKSGYINRVRCYVGYANTYGGKRVAFAIMANNFVGEYKTLTPVFEEFFDLLVRIK